VSTTSLHLVSGSGAAEVVAQTLERLGRDERVLAMRDDYAEGPLTDADDGAASRVAWWSKLRGAPLRPDEAAQFDDADLWALIRATSDDVVLWHGPHPMERIFALRACFHLRDQPQRVHEIAVGPSGAYWADGPRPVLYDAIALSESSELAAVWSRRTKVTDVEVRARSWRALRDRGAESIRVLEGEAIVELPLTAFDEAMVTACRNGDWTRARYVLGWVMTDHPVSPELLSFRLRELLAAGVLQGRGADVEMNLPMELRPAR